MNKAKKYAQNGAVIFGLGNALINVFQQMENKNSNIKFNWSQLIVAAGKGAVIGGTGGLLLGSIRDNKMTQVFKKFGSVPNYLHKSLNYFKDDSTLLLDKAEQVKTKLHSKFKNELVIYPNFSGSVAKGTSIYGSDIDIQLDIPTKVHHSFRSKVHHDSATKCAIYSGAKYTSQIVLYHH